MRTDAEGSTELGALVALQRGTTYKSSLLGYPGPVLLGLASIQRNGGFRGDSLRTYGGESPSKLILTPGDLYVSLKDVTQSADLLGAVSRVPGGVSAGRLTQDTVKLVFKNRKVTADYLYWALRTPQYRSYCRARAIGTTNLSLSRDDFLTFAVPHPTHDRLTLVGLLEDIEAKIQSNHGTNETLDCIARAIFKSWFVDFDPVRTKAEGRRPAGMDAETAELFPAAFDSGEGGRLPRGWRWEPIGEAIEVVGGSTPSTDNPEFWDQGDTAFATPKDLAGLSVPLLLRTGRKITPAGVEQISSGVLPPGTVLLSSRAPIGYLAIATISVCINQGFIAMLPTDTLPAPYVLLWAEDNMATIVGRANGTTFLEISKANFRPIPILIPNAPVLKRFNGIVQPIYARIAATAIETETLAAIRDALLPKLLSGQLRIRDAEKLVEAHT